MAGSAEELRLKKLEDRYADSPVHGFLGLSLSLTSSGQAEVHLPGRAELGNRGGNAAGGIISLLVDSAVVQACRSLLEQECVVSTVEAKVNFLRSVSADATLTAVGEMEFLGQSLGVGTARVVGPDREVVAIGIVTVRIHRHSRSE